MQKQDKLIQELIDYLIRHNSLTSKDYRIEKNISDSDWSQVKKIALERNYIVPGGSEDSYFITQNGKGYGDNRYTEEIQKERDQNELQLKKALEQDETAAWDRKLKKWQVKVFWPILVVSLILHLSTITGLVIKFIEKPVIQKQYIPVDSHGKTYELSRK